ncbi:Lysophospholipase, alpha-beta hydrolase superfamily [Nocardioides scoriae]|uniref:Lysophospholipase, alpha-beta hydrolase superfamily n=1 Tax=Nocardioides scoriae TaxID=642780 RepID=A0A1H1P3E9_9ACTN|nr:Lysophospholipase, alpha-beta hydrolase superfamily [Nocardioides scoriae]
MLLVHGMWSSAATWWRVGPALESRGWQVEAATLPGHGGRPVGEGRTLGSLADDVREHHPGGRRLLVGHSLGAVVALEAAVADPSWAAGVVLVDPPGRSAGRRTRSLGRGRAQDAADARADPTAAVAALLHGHPTWSRRDARGVVQGLLQGDPALAVLPPLAWDLAALVAACPVPVAVIACPMGGSALAGPDREDVRRLVGGRLTELGLGHHVHLDEPAGLVAVVDAFGREVG